MLLRLNMKLHTGQRQIPPGSPPLTLRTAQLDGLSAAADKHGSPAAYAGATA